MLSSILPDKPPFIATPPRKTPSWHKRSCAALLGATTLMSLSLSGPASTPAVAQTAAETKHPLHHGRRHRLDAAEHLPSRADGRRDAQHRPHRTRGRQVHALLRRAELHGRAQRLLHRHEPAAHGHDPAAAARQPDLPAARHAVDRVVPARPRLQHRRVRQEPPGRPHRRAADRPRLPRVLGLSVPPGCDAGRELPGH